MSESHDIEQIARLVRDAKRDPMHSLGIDPVVLARALLPLIAAAEAKGRLDGAKSMQERAVDAAAAWRKPSNIKLAAGEMTAQELRTAQAVAGGIESAVKSLPLEGQTNG
jgi:hypothetical protein